MKYRDIDTLLFAITDFVMASAEFKARPTYDADTYMRHTHAELQRVLHKTFGDKDDESSSKHAQAD